MAASLRSDRALYESLVRSLAPGLYQYAFRLTGRAEAAEDLLQETFCEAWRSLPSLRNPARARAWIFRVLRHRHAHQARARGRRLRALPPAHAPGAALEHLQDPAQDRRRRALDDREMLQHALDGLENRFKVPFLMVFLEGLTCKEAAGQLDLPLGTVLSRIHRARGYLRRRLGWLERADQVHPPAPRLVAEGGS